METMASRISNFARPLRAFFMGCFATGCLFAVMAFAQEAVAPGATGVDIKTMLMGLLATGLTIFGGMLIRIVNQLVTRGSATLERYINDKIENTALEGALNRVRMGAEVVVRDMWQSHVSTLQSVLADGKITAEERKMLAELSMSKLKAITPKKIMSILTGQGMEPDQIEAVLRGSIEAAVFDAKLVGKAASAGSPAAKN